MRLTHLQEMTGLNEAVGPGFFSEAQHYSDSGEFTNEFYDIFSQVNKMKKIMKHPKWMEYMKATDRNFDTSTVSAARTAMNAVTDLETALIEIDREFDRANGDDDDHGFDNPPVDDEGGK